LDIFAIIETLGIPVAVAIGLGYALMYLIKFITRDVKADIKNLYDITVKLIDSNRQSKDETKKTMTAVNTIKDIVIKLFKQGENK
tara:strand:- start:8851 stop:9105 length:255 start_codon:yes stop_codon:yes gene_type:complete